MHFKGAVKSRGDRLSFVLELGMQIVSGAQTFFK